MKPLNLQDVGTLEQHLHQLCDLWSDALAMLLEHSANAKPEPDYINALRRISEVAKQDTSLPALRTINFVASRAITQYETPQPIAVTSCAAAHDLSLSVELLKKTLESTPGIGGTHGNYDERSYYCAVNASHKALDTN